MKCNAEREQVELATCDPTPLRLALVEEKKKGPKIGFLLKCSTWEHYRLLTGIA
jgi:hypothetical protein